MTKQFVFTVYFTQFTAMRGSTHIFQGNINALYKPPDTGIMDKESNFVVEFQIAAHHQYALFS